MKEIVISDRFAAKTAAALTETALSCEKFVKSKYPEANFDDVTLNFMWVSLEVMGETTEKFWIVKTGIILKVYEVSDARAVAPDLVYALSACAETQLDRARLIAEEFCGEKMRCPSYCQSSVWDYC